MQESDFLEKYRSNRFTFGSVLGIIYMLSKNQEKIMLDA